MGVVAAVNKSGEMPSLSSLLTAVLNRSMSIESTWSGASKLRGGKAKSSPLLDGTRRGDSPKSLATYFGMIRRVIKALSRLDRRLGEKESWPFGTLEDRKRLRT